jgi:hypothetical protein
VFEQILTDILRQEGVEAVIFLDSEGETILSYGRIDSDRLKLMGAYQGIVLSIVPRLEIGKNGTVITRCWNRSILTHLLKDGYFVSVIFSKDVNIAHAQFMIRDYFVSLEKEL